VHNGPRLRIPFPTPTASWNLKHQVSWLSVD
jgi:hypothetical protein